MKLTHAPNLWVYKKTGQVQHYSIGHEQYQFPQTQDQAEELIKYIQREFGKTVKIEKPFPWEKVITNVATIFLGIPLAFFFRQKIFDFIRSPKLWVAITMVAVLLFTSGHMFNAIRKVPYLAGDGKGGVAYFVPGHSNQIAIETQIIAGAYAAMAFSSILLVTKVPLLKNPQAQNMAAILFVAIIFLGMSFVISKFHIKNGGYPFWLLKL